MLENSPHGFGEPFYLNFQLKISRYLTREIEIHQSQVILLLFLCDGLISFFLNFLSDGGPHKVM